MIDDFEANLAALRRGEAHVWMSFGQAGQGAEKVAWHLLSDEERRRAGKIQAAADRDGFVLAHALVRAVLSRYHPVVPGVWRFGRGPQGKPFIRAAADAPPLQFNLSHTRGLSACVITLNIGVGVDVERIERHADLLNVAREFFAPAVVQELQNLSGEKQTLRFYEHWTRQEARGKASGTGFAPVSLVNENAEDWRCLQERVSPRHMLAAAMHGGQGSATDFRLRTVRWQAHANVGGLEPCGRERKISVPPIIVT
jgi:phosphopantetheinyl transferase